MITAAQLDRINVLMAQRRGLLQIRDTVRPITECHLHIHSTVSGNLSRFGLDDLGLDTARAKVEVAVLDEFTRVFRTAVLQRLSAVDDELEALGVDVDE